MAEKVGSLYYEITLDTRELIEGQRRVQRELDKTAGDLGGLKTKLTEVAFASAAAAAAIGIMAKSLYEASAAGERLKTMLDFATGGNGTREIEYLRALTNRLGLEFATTAVAYGQFQAAAKGTALEGQKARDVFESVAKSSAVMGLSSSQTSGVLLALQQMISKGTVQAEELRGQLGERLPGAFQIAAKAMGVTTAELGKMLEQGQVVADDFLPKFAAALNENIGNAAENAAGRLDASVNRISSAWDRLKQTVGNSGISRFFANEMEAMSQSMTVVTEAMENTKKAGGGMIAQFASGGGVAVGRAGFELLNGSANLLNGTINLLTGNVFKLRTDLALLPDAFKTNAQQSAIMGEKIQEAQAKLVRLQELDAQPMNGNYYKSAIAATSEYIAKLKEAQAQKQGLQGGSDPRDIPANMQRGASFAKYELEQKKAAEELMAVRQRQSGVNKTYLADLNTYQESLKRGLITEKEYIDAVSDLARKTYNKSDSGGKSNPKTVVQKFDSEGYLADLEAKSVDAWERIDIIEQEAIRKNDELLQKGDIRFEAHQRARTLILADAEQERAKLREAGFQKEVAEAERRQAEQDRRKSNQDVAKREIAATNPIDAIRFEEEQRIAVIEQYRLQDLANTQLYEDAKAAIHKKASADIKAVQDANMVAQLQGYGQLFGGVADLTKTFAGEQSGVYQAMFAASKAFAMADAIVKIQNAMASASMSLPFPGNLGAMATVAAQTAGIVSTIASTNYGGARQYGGPVSSGSLYRINETGAPEMFTANNGNQYMLPTKSGSVTAADSIGGGGINVNVSVDATGSSVEGDNAQAKQLGAMIGNAVRAVLIQEKRNGGLLA